MVEKTARRAPARIPKAVVPQGLKRAEHVLFVLGGLIMPDGTPAPRVAARLELTLELAERDPSAIVLLSGGVVTSEFIEARVMERWLTERGLSTARIVREEQARLTVENIELAIPLLKEMSATKVTLVTSHFHMNRSHVLLRSALNASGLSHVRISRAGSEDRLARRERLHRYFTEVKDTARDLINQHQLRRAGELFFVPAQVMKIGKWSEPASGYVNWNALFKKQ